MSESRLTRAMNVVFLLYVVSLATTMSGMELFSSVLGLLVVIQWVRLRGALKALPFLKPILAFVAVALLGTLFNDATWSEKLQDISRQRFFLIYAMLFFFLRDSCRGVGSRWLGILGVVTFAIGIYGVFQHFIPLDLVRPTGKKIILYAIAEKKLGPLVLGTFNHHLTFSNIYLFYACLFLGVGLCAFPSRARYAGLGLLLFLVCVWTQSRAAWVAIPLCLVCLFAARSLKLAVAAMAGCLVLMAVFYGTDPAFRERVDRTLFVEDDLYNLGPRARLWKAQLEMFREHPILGVGFNHNERRAKAYVDRLFPNRADNFYGHAHSAPLQVLSTMGLLGLGAYLWLWWEIFARILRIIRGYGRERLEQWIAVGLAAGFVGFHVQGLTQWNFGDAEVLHNVMFFMAVVAAIPLPARVPPKWLPK